MAEKNCDVTFKTYCNAICDSNVDDVLCDCSIITDDNDKYGLSL